MFARADGIHLDRRGGRISAKVAMTETALAELLSQDLSGLDLVAVIFDVAQDSTHLTLSYSSHIAISGTDSGISSALPTSTAVPPARSERIPFRIAGVAPEASMNTWAPKSWVDSVIGSTTRAPYFDANSRRAGSMSDRGAVHVCSRCRSRC